MKNTTINLNLKLFLEKITSGKEKIVIDIKLKLYVPIKDKICNEFIYSVQLKTIKFQGKPPKINPLTNSITEKINEKSKIVNKFFSNLKNEKIYIPKP